MPVTVTVLSPDEIRALVVDVVREVVADALKAREPPRQDRPAAKYLTTKDAAIEYGTTSRAILRHVQRGELKPDLWGGRGAGREHRFKRETLDVFYGRKRT